MLLINTTCSSDRSFAISIKAKSNVCHSTAACKPGALQAIFTFVVNLLTVCTVVRCTTEDIAAAKHYRII